MNANDEKELKELLENMSDTYDDFVRGVMLFSKRHGGGRELIDYIKSDRDITTSKVLDFQYRWEIGEIK